MSCYTFTLFFYICTDLKCPLSDDSIGNTFCLYVLKVQTLWVMVRGRTYCKIYVTSMVIEQVFLNLAQIFTRLLYSHRLYSVS